MRLLPAFGQGAMRFSSLRHTQKTCQMSTVISNEKRPVLSVVGRETPGLSLPRQVRILDILTPILGLYTTGFDYADSPELVLGCSGIKIFKEVFQILCNSNNSKQHCSVILFFQSYVYIVCMSTSRGVSGCFIAAHHPFQASTAHRRPATAVRFSAFLLRFGFFICVGPQKGLRTCTSYDNIINWPKETYPNHEENDQSSC